MANDDAPKSIKINPNTYRKLRTLAKREQRTITATLDRAVNAYADLERRTRGASI